jgi:hypothetical protein
MSLTDEQILKHWRGANIALLDHRVGLSVGRAIESATAAPLLERIKELEQQLEAERKDAGRYRWLRDTSNPDNHMHMIALHINDAQSDASLSGIDAAIDAAISKEQAAPQQQEPKCTCLTSQLGPHYCERCSP